MAKKYIVTIDNDLTESRYRLSFNEQRLILSIISRIVNIPPAGYYEKLDKNTFYYVSFEECSTMWGLTLKHTKEALHEAVQELHKRVWWLKRDEKGEDAAHWISRYHFDLENGRVGIKWSEEIIPYISSLRSHFSSFDLQNVTRLSSPVGIRLYILINQCRLLEKKEIEYTLEELRKMFCLDKKYPEYSQFRQFVLDPHIKDINENTDFRVTYIPNKDGTRKVQKITFVLDKIVKRRGDK